MSRPQFGRADARLALTAAALLAGASLAAPRPAGAQSAAPELAAATTGADSARVLQRLRSGLGCTDLGVTPRDGLGDWWRARKALRDLARPRQPAYALRQLPPGDVKRLRQLLAARCWPEALHLAIGAYQPELPAWMVYIDSSGAVTQAFISRNDTKVRLRSQRYVWAMVFMDRPMQRAATGAAAPPPLPSVVAAFQTREGLWTAATTRADAARQAAEGKPGDAALTGAAVSAHNSAADAYTRLLEAAKGVSDAAGADAVGDTSQLRFARRTQVFQPDPVLTTLVKGIGKAFGVTGPADAPRLDDSVKVVTLRQVSTDSTAASMRMGFQRFSLVENSVVEVALSPVPGKQFPPPPAAAPLPPPPQLRSVYANLANARERTFELGILAGYTYGRPIPTYDTSLRVTKTSSSTAVNGYLTAVVNPLWFRLPWRNRQAWRRASLGGFVGTNVLNGTIGDQIVFGGSLGHLVSDAGLSIGSAIIEEPRIADGRVVTRRKPRFLGGVDLRF